MPKETRTKGPTPQTNRQSKPASVQVAKSPAVAPAEVQHARSEPLSSSSAQIAQLQRQYGNRAVQRLIQREQALVQRQAPIGLEGGEVSGDLQTQIDSARGGGQPLDKGVGSQIGGALGADFSGVRVHTDSKADKLNRSLSAKAFTLGSDVFFSEGAYEPGTQGGKQLLAHELTHVVQQGGAAGQHKVNKVQTKLTVGPAGDKYEQEADRFAKSLTGPASLMNAPVKVNGLQRQTGVVQRAVGDEGENAPTTDQQPEAQENQKAELPLFLQVLQWGFKDDPKKMYKMLAPKEGDVGGGKLSSVRRGAQRVGAGLATGVSGAITGSIALGGVGLGLGLGAAALPVVGLGAGLGYAGRGVEKLTNYATGDKDTPATFEGTSKMQKAKYVGKGLLSPLSLLGLGLGAAGRGVEKTANYVRGKEDKPVEWKNKSKTEKAKDVVKYVSLGLLSPALLPILAIGAAGRALGIPEKVRGLADTLRGVKKSTWDPAAPHQRESLVGSSGAAGGGVVGGGVGGVAGFVSSNVKGSDYVQMPDELRQADLALRNRPVQESNVSEVGQGFGAAGGIIGGLSGLFTTGSGIRGLAREKGRKKLTRGVGRIGAGLGTTFAGITTAGKSISTLMGSTTSAAQFMMTAALPAQVAMSGVDVIKGGYMGIKAYSRYQELNKVATLPQIQADPERIEFVEMAKEYMKKRGRNAGLSVLAGALGIVGGALMLSGFGAVVGAPILIASAAVKLGTMFGPMIRDKIMDKWKGKDQNGKSFSERKKERETKWAAYAARYWRRTDVQLILMAMGMEQKMLNSLEGKTTEEVTAVMRAWLMRR